MDLVLVVRQSPTGRDGQEVAARPPQGIGNRYGRVDHRARNHPEDKLWRRHHDLLKNQQKLLHYYYT